MQTPFDFAVLGRCRLQFDHQATLRTEQLFYLIECLQTRYIDFNIEFAILVAHAA